MASGFRRFRIAVLLVVLAGVAAGTWLARVRSTDWDLSLHVAVYPIDGDGSPATDAYIRALDSTRFAAIDEFMRREGARYRLALATPVRTRLGPRLAEMPPPPRGGSALDVARWSLELRWWANGIEDAGIPPDVRVFAVYFDPERRSVLAHSLGLQKGLIGVVNLFARDDMTESNSVVIAHELLHTLGATDKYDPRSNQPSYPDGYADPMREPRFPQERAEIMAGRIPTAPGESDTPEHLDDVVIGPATAAEINWGR